MSQRLRHLESRQGMQLAHRSTRRFRLTEEGELFHAGAVARLADLERLVGTLRERSGDVLCPFPATSRRRSPRA